VGFPTCLFLFIFNANFKKLKENSPWHADKLASRQAGKPTSWQAILPIALFTIHHSPFTIHHSPFTIHHSRF
jgi:hypothetical protein